MFEILLPIIGEVLKKVVPDTAQRDQLNAQLTTALAENERAILDAARSVIVAEASSESPLARNWRPVLMYLLMALIVWIAVIAPVFGIVDQTLRALTNVPDNIWTLLIVGMSGYMVGQSGERIAKMFTLGKGK